MQRASEISPGEAGMASRIHATAHGPFVGQVMKWSKCGPFGIYPERRARGPSRYVFARESEEKLSALFASN